MNNRDQHEPVGAGSLLPAVLSGFCTEAPATRQAAADSDTDYCAGDGTEATAADTDCCTGDGTESAPQHSAVSAPGWDETRHDWARYGYKYVPEEMIKWQRHDCDYVKDGILYCGHCHTAKESIHRLQGRKLLTAKVWCLCMCQAKEACNTVRRKKERRLLAEEYRREALPIRAMHRWTFTRDNGSNPEAHARGRLYAQQFDKLREKGMGLLLLGPNGCGKTYLAVQIVNALCDRGYCCRFTSFTEIVSEIGANREGRRNYIRNLCRHDLIVLDEFGVELGVTTPTTDSILYELADALYKTGTPVIVTSPLSYAALLQNAGNATQSTAVCRILERCCCLKLEGSCGITRAMDDLAWAESLIAVPVGGDLKQKDV